MTGVPIRAAYAAALWCVALAVAAPRGFAQSGVLTSSADSAARQKARPARRSADSLYFAARELLNRGQFSAAAAQFERLRQSYKSSRYAAEARYWQAYALFRTTPGPSVLRTALALLDEQMRRYPKSPVAADAAELATRIRGYLAAGGDAEAAHDIIKAATDPSSKVCGADVEVRLAALSALQNMQWERTLPTLRRLFNQRDSCSAPLRRGALTLLAVRPIRETEGAVILAASDPDSEVRRRAIPLLAQATSDTAVRTMARLLANTREQDLRETLLNALAYNTNPSARRMLKEFVERPHGDDASKERAISSLIASSCGGPSGGAGEAPPDTVRRENAGYLRDLYKSLRSQPMRVAVVSAVVQLASAESIDWLLGIAADPAESLDVRRTALYATGVIVNGDQPGPPPGPRRYQYGCGASRTAEYPVVPVATLVKLYNSIDDRTIRGQLLYGLSVRDGDAAALAKLAAVAQRDEDLELRQRAVFWLSQSKNPKAADALADIVTR